MKKPNITHKSRVSPLLKYLPSFVKDPANVYKIERALLETLACPKLHSEVIDMAECKKCTKNMLIRRQLMKEFGFHNQAIYYAWKKTHYVMRKRVPLQKYNT